MTDISPTLGINERVLRLRAEGRPVFHFGFGEAPFPVPPRLRDALAAHASEKAYLPVAGLPALRDAVLEHQARLTGIDPERFDVLIGPGSKVILFAAQCAVPGDLLLPVPSWVSYAPQATILGQRVIPVPTDLSDHGYRLDTTRLRDAITTARAAGRDPTKLLINFPSNPTGLQIDTDTLTDLTDTCRREGVLLISDEIYGRLSYDRTYRSAAAVWPDGTLVTSGLSKHLSLGGWRLGIGLIPRGVTGLFERLCHIASETWSCVAAPIQHAAIEAYVGHDDIEAWIDDTTAVHAIVNTRVAEYLRARDVDCPLPQGGFYTYPDFASRVGHRFADSGALATALLDEAGIAALPGRAFGETPSRLTLRLAACDYDGAAALELWRQSRPEARTTLDCERLAPSVEASLDAFASFMDADRMA